jgi:anti-sigma factor RsiW
MSTSPLSCREAARQLWALLDNDLLDAERHAVLEHLWSCAECESHRRHAEAFRRAVRSAGQRMDPPATLQPRIRQALQRAAERT